MGELGVHWEAAAPPPSPQAAVAAWEVIRRYHMAHGYADIAYSFGVDDFGQIHVGRGWDRDTAANGPGHNAGNRAVCWLGGPGYSPTGEAYTAASQVVHEGMVRGFTVIRPHSDYVATACPGNDWRAWVARAGWNDGDTPPPGDEDDMQHPLSLLRSVEDGRVFSTDGMTKRYLPSQDAITLLVDLKLADPAILDRPKVYVDSIPRRAVTVTVGTLLAIALILIIVLVIRRL